MPEPAAGWMTMVDEDEVSDDIEFDPRWEVQPVPEDDVDRAGDHKWIFIVSVIIVLIVAFLLWPLANAPSV